MSFKITPLYRKASWPCFSRCFYLNRHERFECNPRQVSWWLLSLPDYSVPFPRLCHQNGLICLQWRTWQQQTYLSNLDSTDQHIPCLHPFSLLFLNHATRAFIISVFVVESFRLMDDRLLLGRERLQWLHSPARLREDEWRLRFSQLFLAPPVPQKHHQIFFFVLFFFSRFRMMCKSQI